MRLGRLTGLERDKLTDEGRELRTCKASRNPRLRFPTHGSHRGRATCNQRRVRKSSPHRTRNAWQGNLSEDLVADEDCVVTVSQAGYIKRVPLDICKPKTVVDEARLLRPHGLKMSSTASLSRPLTAMF